MKRSYLQHTFAAVLLVSACAGCEQKPEAVPSSAPQAGEKLTPEQSFELIVETFRRGVEEVPIDFVVQGSSGQTMMTGRNEVSDELIPPTKEGDPYKAVITVKSTSRYLLQKSNEEPKASDKTADAVAAGSTDESDAQILDPDVVSNPAERHAKADANQVTVASRDDGQERAYELVYENGRWKLISKLDPKTEGAIQFAFERALKSQG